LIEALDLNSEAFEGLRYEHRGPIAVITLDRPARGNALTARMHQGLRAIWEDVRDDPALRVVVFTASGTRHFCTGADVGDLAAKGTVSAGSGSLREELFYTARQNEVWKPVICAVNGLVVASGLQFVVDADLVVAAEGAAFTDTHVNIGMVGALENMGLAKRLPLGAALRLTLLGPHYRMSARRGYELGLVDEVVAPADLLPTALAMAEYIAAQSPAAVSRSLEAIWGSLDAGYAEALERGWSIVKSHRSHPDAREGPRARLEQRPPNWQLLVGGGPADRR
jgi:E-phenylitaconyl-CoA hydratase